MSAFLAASRLRRLVDSSASVIPELGLEGLLDRLLEAAFVVTDAGSAALAVMDSERHGLDRFITQGLSQDAARVIGTAPLSCAMRDLMTNDRRLVRIGDIDADPRSYGFPARHAPLRTFLGATILIREEPCGAIYVAEKRDGGFDDGDEEWILTLAAWASIAVEHDRLLPAASRREKELEHAVRALAATQTIAVAVGAETDISRVLELVAKLGLAMVEARTLIILLQDGEDLVVVAGAGRTQPRIGVRIPVAASTSGSVMRKQRPLRISDVGLELLVPPRILGVPDAGSGLLVPLTYRGQPLGVLAAFDRSSTPTAFTDDDEQILVAVAASAATAVATAQTVQADRLRTTLDAAEAERKRWARELHDETLHTLAKLKVLASNSRREANLGRMLEALDEVVSGLQEEIENVHAIIWELRPAALDDLGLRAAMEALAERHRVAYGVEVLSDLELPDPAAGDRRLAPELETAVYRLVQEALDNVAKHADADRIRIRAVVGTRRLMLEIIDDGSGFDVSAVGAGYGLTGMRERAALAAGTLEIVSGPGGTAIRAALPARFVSRPLRPAPDF